MGGWARGERRISALTVIYTTIYAVILRAHPSPHPLAQDDSWVVLALDNELRNAANPHKHWEFLGSDGRGAAWERRIKPGATAKGLMPQLTAPRFARATLRSRS